MRDLTNEEENFLKIMILQTPQNHNKYMVFNKTIKTKRYRIKRSRALMQLHLKKKLEMWEIIHHKDGNRENDSINNLEVIDTRYFDYPISEHLTGRRSKNS